ncbi:MAG TPA: sigma-70 family RNA polymerase sigma factor, partial [Caldilineaceae bacterium]|nr:sigma-70 family RNA polymerase sigma factor [Caldilineaceae bacterium]
MPANFEPPPQPADGELIASCLAGDINAFAALIERHRARVERLLRVLIHNRAARDDLWQETLLRAYFHLDQLRDRQRFAAWFCSIAVNLARSERNTGAPQTLSWESLGEATSQQVGEGKGATNSPEEAAIRREMAGRIRQAINDLPPAERDAVLLVYL